MIGRLRVHEHECAVLISFRSCPGASLGSVPEDTSLRCSSILVLLPTSVSPKKLYMHPYVLTVPKGS